MEISSDYIDFLIEKKLTGTQYRIIFTLMNSKDPLTASDIQRKLQIERKQTITVPIKELKKLKIIRQVKTVGMRKYYRLAKLKKKEEPEEGQLEFDN